MFGVTGTAAGKQTKIDCTHTLYVKQGKAFKKVEKGNYVLQHGTAYKQITEQELQTNYKVVEGN